MLTAEYGGTGGKPIEGGLVVEEPDIEIGAGVSSKGTTLPSCASCLITDLCIAISRRMATDRGGYQGPRSSRDGFGPGPVAQDRYRQPERPMHDNNPIGIPPPVPGFGFQFPPMPNSMSNGMPNGIPNGIPNGMPIFPPGFMPPGGAYGQPPPPGAI